MPHGAIIGTTDSGKTFLARQLARMFICKKVPVISLHKPGEPWKRDEVTWQTCYPDLFLDYYLSFKGQCAAFMELADADVDKYDARFHGLFTKGKHMGRRNFFLAQRGQMVHPTIRENCVMVWLFSCGRKAAKVWAEEFGKDELLESASLPPFVYLHMKSRFDVPQKRVLKI